MAQRYAPNYDWSQLGPVPWTVTSVVTLQYDLHSYDDGNLTWAAVSQWWEALDKVVEPDLLPSGDVVGVAGACRFPQPVRVSDHHITGWILSRGEDAFDAIARHAEQLRLLAVRADATVAATWTELPHRRPTPTT